MERFKDIPGYEGLYQVSTHGNVYSVRSNKVLRPGGSGDGYSTIALCVNKKCSSKKIHRLVMLTFIGPSNLQVNHIDGNKLNNCLNNLEYCTQRDNIKHAHILGLRDNCYKKGSSNSQAKLTEQDIPIIRQLLVDGVSKTEIARTYHVDRKVIYNIQHKKRWRHV